ncbi:MAG TPA: type II secretion system F family protein [Acidobacteriota bacterium]|nr:type II secretion system F family protein [Acidobacteriota bacterium]
MRLLDTFGKAFVPKNAQPHLREYLLKAGISDEPYSFFGGLFFAAMFLTSLAYLGLVYPQLDPENTVYFFLGTFVSFAGIGLILVTFCTAVIYLYLDLVIYRRTGIIEQILPDYLQLVSTNLKSGLPFDRALWMAIKPRFGVLAVEMELVLKRVMTGHDLSDALVEFSMKYESPMVRRAMNLIVGELDSGGKISHIIDGLVTNLKNNQKLKAEMAASVITYMIFIGAIVIVISPALFALSYHLLNFMDTFVLKLSESGASANSPINIRAGSIDVGRFKDFSTWAVVVVSILSSMIVSIIERGNIKSGLKYIPIFLIGSLFCYYIFSLILQSIFGGIAL